MDPLFATEPVRVLFPLDGYTMLVFERYEHRVGMVANPMFSLDTAYIPVRLRNIGSRFAVEFQWRPSVFTPELSIDEVRQRQRSFYRILEEQ